MTLEEKNPTRNRISAFVIALSGYYIGYCLPIFNSMATPMFCGYFGLTVEEKDSIQGTLNFLFCFAAMFGVLSLAYFNDTFGRLRTSMGLDFCMILVAILFQVNNIYTIEIARLLNGFLTGMYNMSARLTLVEMMPRKLSSDANLWICVISGVMSLVSFLQQLFISQAWLSAHWSFVLAWPTAISVLRLIYFNYAFDSDTPVYIYQQHKNCPDLHSKLHESFSMIYKDTNLDQHIETYIAEKSKTELKSLGLLAANKELFTEKYYDRTVGAILLKVFESFTGFPFLIFFSTSFFEKMGMNGKFISFLLGIFYIVGSLIGVATINKFKRIDLMLGGLAIQSMAFLFMYFFVILNIQFMVPVFVTLFMMAYMAGIGGVNSMYIAELLPAQAIGITMALGWIIWAFVGKLSIGIVGIFGETNTLLFYGLACAIICWVLKKYLVEPNTEVLAKETTSPLIPLVDLRLSYENTRKSIDKWTQEYRSSVISKTSQLSK